MYKIGTLNFVRASSIKTHEKIISLQNGLQTIGMVRKNSIESHLKANYRFMIIRLVQIAIKCLVKRGFMLPFTWH